jgi:putative DNA primase/helicase
MIPESFMGDERPPLTDAGNAQCFAREHHEIIRWVPEWGTWVRYDGKRWRRTPGEEITTLAIRTARGFFLRAADPSIHAKDRDELTRHAKSSESAGRLDAMVRLARGLLSERASEFDADPWLLNVENGTINLRTPGEEFRPHRREDMLTKIAPVTWDPSATYTTWSTFLERVLPDPGARAWLQRYAGYGLTGDVGEQVLAFLHGRGANGKTTFLEVVMAVLGEYAKAGAPDLLLAKNGEAHPTEQADLQGARLVVCQEVEAGRAWAERTVKALTGGDRLKARFMRCDFFEFSPSHKLIVAANHRPKVRGQDEAIWRRIKLVPFEVTIPKAERDPDLTAKLRAEAAGILVWLVGGCLLWQRDGLGDAPAIAQASAGYRAEQDHLGHFIEEECTLAPDGWELTTALYDRYSAWCSRSGARPWERETFREGLLERGLEAARRGVGRGIRGVRIGRAA